MWTATSLWRCWPWAWSGPLGFPAFLPNGSIPATAAIADLLLGVIGGGDAGAAVRPLVQPVAFLLAAVPLAVLLDQLGFFATVAARLTRRGGGAGGLWALAALVTTVLNLDASVVLLTPLYVRVAREREWDVLGLAVQPVLLACLASSALPVSNLTNLIVVAWDGATTGQFLAHLALPSMVATVAGWVFYKRALGDRVGLSGPTGEQIGGERGPMGLAVWGAGGSGGARRLYLRA